MRFTFRWRCPHGVFWFHAAATKLQTTILRMCSGSTEKLNHIDFSTTTASMFRYALTILPRLISLNFDKTFWQIVSFRSLFPVNYLASEIIHREWEISNKKNNKNRYCCWFFLCLFFIYWNYILNVVFHGRTLILRRNNKFHLLLAI